MPAVPPVRNAQVDAWIGRLTLVMFARKKGEDADVYVRLREVEALLEEIARGA